MQIEYLCLVYTFTLVLTVITQVCLSVCYNIRTHLRVLTNIVCVRGGPRIPIAVHTGLPYGVETS